MQNNLLFKNIGKKIRNKILKLLNYKNLLAEENLNLKKTSNKFCKKTKIYIYVSYLGVISPN
jgi:hypothetical protein